MDSQAEEEARKKKKEGEGKRGENKRLRGTWDGEGKLETAGLRVWARELKYAIREIRMQKRERAERSLQ